MTRSRSSLSIPLACALALVTTMGTAHAGTAPTASGGPATGGPGAASYYDLARKDCLGTARNTKSGITGSFPIRTPISAPLPKR